MKLINSGVAFSAARIKSPSFSRLASSVTITRFPWRISSRTSSIGSNTMVIGSHHSLRISFHVKLGGGEALEEVPVPVSGGLVRNFDYQAGRESSYGGHKSSVTSVRDLIIPRSKRNSPLLPA